MLDYHPDFKLLLRTLVLYYWCTSSILEAVVVFVLSILRFLSDVALVFIPVHERCFSLGLMYP